MSKKGLATNPGHGDNGLEKNFFLLLLVLVTLLFLFLLKPFWGSIFWACIMALIFSPLNDRLLAIFGNKRNLASSATLSICVVLLIAPMIFVGASFFQEGVALYQRLQSGDLDLGARIERVREAFPAVQNFLERINLDLETVKDQLSGAALTVTQFIAKNAVQLGQGTVEFFVALSLMLYVAFFLLRDGKSLVSLLVRALPLGDEREHLLLAKFAEVTRATVKGNLLVAAAQGTLGGMIFWLLGIPGALLWGVVMTLFSLIPVVGAGLIWGPVAIYLLAVGEWLEGLILFVFGAAVIGLIDNLLRPVLVGRDTKLPDYVVLLSTLGGFALFGMNGFVLGPLVAALFMAFWEIFMREFNVANSVFPRDDAGAGEKQD